MNKQEPWVKNLLVFVANSPGVLVTAQFGSFLSTPSLVAFFCVDLFLEQTVPPGRGQGDPFPGARSHQISSLMGSGVFFPIRSGYGDVIQWVSVNLESH